MWVETLAQRCLTFVITDDEHDDRLGDLDEAYARDLSRFGEREARRRRERNILSCILSIASRRSGLFLQDQVLPATAAVLIALTGYASLSRATAETWWIKSGIERNPGYFVSENEIGYPVCEPLDRGERASHAVVVPKSARITKVYCGAPGRPIRLSDDNYTRGRVLTAPVGFRVVWEE